MGMGLFEREYYIESMDMMDVCVCVRERVI